MPLATNVITFIDRIIMKENRFSSSHEQIKCNLGNLVGFFFLKYLLCF